MLSSSIYIKLIVHFNGKIASSFYRFFFSLENCTNIMFECSKMFAFQQATGWLLLAEVIIQEANGDTWSPG